MSVDKYKKYFGGFELRWAPATRSSKFGRASGGCLYGYKKQNLGNSLKIAFGNNCSVDFITLNICNSCVYIIPVYLNRRDWQNDFMNIKNFFMNSGPNKFMILGD